jgi:hypothetical protein
LRHTFASLMLLRGAQARNHLGVTGPQLGSLYNGRL